MDQQKWVAYKEIKLRYIINKRDANHKFPHSQEGWKEDESVRQGVTDQLKYPYPYNIN